MTIIGITTVKKRPLVPLTLDSSDFDNKVIKFYNKVSGKFGENMKSNY